MTRPYWCRNCRTTPALLDGYLCGSCGHIARRERRLRVLEAEIANTIYIPPSPRPDFRTPCADDPTAMDIPRFARHSRNRIKMATEYGLSLCAMCPLDVRAWCLECVRPDTSLYTGIAGLRRDVDDGLIDIRDVRDLLGGDK